MPVGGAIAVVGSAAIGAKTQADAAKDAANAQVKASKKANALEREIYYDQRGLLAPSIRAGADARARQMLMMGYSPEAVKTYLRETGASLAQPSQTQPAGRPRQRTPIGNVMGGIFGNASGGGNQPPPAPPTINAVPGEDYSWVDDYDWQASSPSYGFRFDEGQRAFERSKAAGGDFYSGDTARGLTRYGQDFASTEFENDWNRLGQLAGDGTAATGTTVNVAGAYGQRAGDNINRAGAARASGYQQAGNAWGNFWNDTIPGAIGAGYGYGAKGGWGN